jgi:hypothetical protein
MIVQIKTCRGTLLEKLSNTNKNTDEKNIVDKLWLHLPTKHDVNVFVNIHKQKYFHRLITRELPMKLKE